MELNRLTDKELEKGKHLFKVEGQMGLICWYLYNKSVPPMDIDKHFEFSPNTTNAVIRRNLELFEKVDKIGKRIVFTTSEEGRKLVEKIIKS